MKKAIGIVYDTHSLDLPEKMLKEFRKVDFIIHAGDFCTLKDVQRLEKIKQVKAVCGNRDEDEIRQIFPRKQILEIGALHIGVFHGEGSPTRILGRVKEEFANDKVDCIIFGHSHQPFNQIINDVLYFNPGSPNDICAACCSYGILEINGKKIIGKLIKVK